MRRQPSSIRDEDMVATILVRGPEPLAASIRGTGDDDVLNGTSGKDRIMGLAGDDQLFGNAGRDVLIGGAGADQLDGGDGVDVADYAGTQAISIVFDASGTSTVHVAGDSDDTITAIERINGSDVGDTFDITAAQPGSIYSGGGDDTFYADPLAFDPKNTFIQGGQGIDTVDLSHDTAPLSYDPGRLLKFNFSSSGVDDVIGSRFADEIQASNAATTSTIHGMDGGDLVRSSGFGRGFLFGDTGDDQIFAYCTFGEAHGGVGDDVIAFALANGNSGAILSPLLVDGGVGNDTIRYQNFQGVLGYKSITLELGRHGADGSYTLPDGTLGVLRSVENVDQGLHGSLFGIQSTIYGNEQANTLVGSGMSDVIAANGRAAPRSNGDMTLDVITGGHGADSFLITNVTARQGHVITTDTITDFSQSERDKIDLSEVDAKPKTGTDDDFSFIGGDAFTGRAGDLRFEIVDGSTFVMADTDGDETPDFTLKLAGQIMLTIDDFIF